MLLQEDDLEQEEGDQESFVLNEQEGGDKETLFLYRSG
jgi:hypothetical protein